MAAGLVIAVLGAARAQPYSPVSEADVVGLQLNHYFTPDRKPHAPDFEWTFTRTEFVVRKSTGAIPAELVEQLLGKGATADEIRGRWMLAAGNGQQLVLSDIVVGDTIVEGTVRLPTFKTAPTVVRIGEPQYVFQVR